MNRPHPLAKEAEWTAWLAKLYHAEAEKRLPCGARVDLVTPEYAIEVDWPYKWPEAIGQAVFYGASLNLAPAVILLMGRGKREVEKGHYLRCLAACVRSDVWLIAFNLLEKTDNG